MLMMSKRLESKEKSWNMNLINLSPACCFNAPRVSMLFVCAFCARLSEHMRTHTHTNGETKVSTQSDTLKIRHLDF